MFMVWPPVVVCKVQVCAEKTQLAAAVVACSATCKMFCTTVRKENGENFLGIPTYTSKASLLLVPSLDRIPCQLSYFCRTKRFVTAVLYLSRKGCTPCMVHHPKCAIQNVHVMATSLCTSIADLSSKTPVSLGPTREKFKNSHINVDTAQIGLLFSRPLQTAPQAHTQRSNIAQNDGEKKTCAKTSEIFL